MLLIRPPAGISAENEDRITVGLHESGPLRVPAVGQEEQQPGLPFFLIDPGFQKTVYRVALWQLKDISGVKAGDKGIGIDDSYVIAGAEPLDQGTELLVIVLQQGDAAPFGTETKNLRAFRGSVLPGEDRSDYGQQDIRILAEKPLKIPNTDDPYTGIPQRPDLGVADLLFTEKARLSHAFTWIDGDHTRVFQALDTGFPDTEPTADQNGHVFGGTPPAAL